MSIGCGVAITWVTANKALAGGELEGWHSLQAALAHGSHYGDSATVGAGLPVLSTLRRLRLCGDELLTLDGVFSGSLSWLFNHYDGSRPFSALLRESRELWLHRTRPALGPVRRRRGAQVADHRSTCRVLDQR